LVSWLLHIALVLIGLISSGFAPNISLSLLSLIMVHVVDPK
jgi:hypothetical protein